MTSNNEYNVEKYKQLKSAIQRLDFIADTIRKYDAVPHVYGGEELYQAEAYMIASIGRHAGITLTDLSKQKQCSKSACSQIIKKLMQKSYVYRKRNQTEYREFNLYLTELGETVFQAHEDLNETVTQRYFNNVDRAFSQEELHGIIRFLDLMHGEFAEDLK